MKSQFTRLLRANVPQVPIRRPLAPTLLPHVSVHLFHLTQFVARDSSFPSPTSAPPSGI